ncbi:DUF4145 domain-containing protein [Paraburkholderia fungorum]|uniref:DUF4145 domain-containing protein n=1 Tax=Paraburkholderia fungorum TaxID=134537 RepID=UPI00402BB0E3
MFSITLKCPHCEKEGGFAVRQLIEYFARNPAPLGSVQVNLQPEIRNVDRGGKVRAYGAAACLYCHGPVLIWLECYQGQIRSLQDAVESARWRYVGESPRILGTYPSRRRHDDSPLYPAKLREVFVEVQEDERNNRTPARIITTCRSVLEVALRELGYKDGNLLARIDKARDDGLLTESMRQWAHHARLQGSEAIHELSATKEEATELVAFLRLFMEVAFVLPKRISEKNR